MQEPPSIPTLADIGISKKLSSRGRSHWRRSRRLQGGGLGLAVYAFHGFGLSFGFLPCTFFVYVSRIQNKQTEGKRSATRKRRKTQKKPYSLGNTAFS